MRWPRHKGRDKSSYTLSRKKFPPSTSLNSLGWDTSPITLLIFKAASNVMYRGGMPWSWSRKLALSNLTSPTGTSFSYHCMTTKCLSKLHGSLERILSTSILLSKVKSTIWSPLFWILKPLRDLHKGLKVFAIASIFRALFVRNFAIMEKSKKQSSLVRLHPGPLWTRRDDSNFELDLP